MTKFVFFPFLPDLHNSSNSPGNATSTTAYGPIYNPAAPPPSTENYLGGGGGLGDHESQHALRLAGSGSGSESGVGGDIAGNFRGAAAAASSVIESTSDGGFLAAGFPATGAHPPAYPVHC